MPTRPLPSDPSLEHLKGQAKRLQRLVRDGDARALALVRELHPRLGAIDAGSPDAAAFRLADAQLVVARRYRFPTWPKLRRHVEVVMEHARSPHRQPVGGRLATDAERADELLRLACLTYDASLDSLARLAEARELLAAHPELAAASVGSAAAVGDVEALRALLAADPAAARRRCGPFRWEPLLYLAYGRLGDDGAGRDSLTAARLLLGAGADPNAGYLWEGLPSPFTALTGAFGRGEGDPPQHAHMLELARLLLDAGADPNDAQTVYNWSWTPGDEWLELLLARGLGTGDGGPWHALLAPAHPTPRELLEDVLSWSVRYGMASRVRLVLAAGVDPDGQGTRHPILRGRAPFEQAILDGNEEIAGILRAAGATPPALDPVQELVAAALRADRAAARQLVAADPVLVEQTAGREPQLLIRAVELGRADALRLLVELGFDVNHVARLTPLHQAAFDGNLELVRLLLELGADPTLRDGDYDATPAGWAEHAGKTEAMELLRALE